MMQQINPGLMKVLAAQSQINPVTPEGNTSVAANVLAQAGQAPGIAAIGQQAQEALPSMMRNAQDDQAKQMLEAANRASQPAGIAGLNIPMGQFAEGGVVGYNGTEDSYVDPAGGVYGSPRIDSNITWREALGLGNIANRKVLEEIEALEKSNRKQLQDVNLDNVDIMGGVSFVPSEQEVNKPTTSQATRFDFAPGSNPMHIINVLSTELKNEKDLTPENRTAIAKEIERQYEIYRSQQRVVTAEEAARRAAGPSGIGGLPSATGTIPGSEFFDQARQEWAKRKLTEELTPQQVRAKQDEYLRSLGMPTSLRPAEEARLAEMAKFDAQTREDNARRNKEAMQNAWMSGILKRAQNMASMFSGAAEGMIGEEGRQREQAIKDAALQRQQMMAANEIRAKLDAADRADALGDVATADKLREAARNDQNAQAVGLANIFAKQGEQAVEYRKGVDAARIAAEQKAAGTGERQDIVELRALIASLRDQADPMKNFDKPSRERAAILLGQAQDKLVHMSSLSGLPGGQIAPPVGTVMQGYRFKGGNPADRNNWEKV